MKLRTIIAICSVVVFAASTHAQTIFEDDFTSSSVSDQTVLYLGGWFTPQAAFEQWYGNASEASISSDSLNLNSTNNTRGAFILLDPALFPSAGAYTLSIDIASLNLGNANNTAVVRVFTGSGYDLTGTSADAIVINTQSGQATASGNASVLLAAEFNPTTIGTGQTISFNRDSNDAVAIFLGVNAAAWEFPTMSIGQVSVIPEPTTGLLLLGGLLLLATRRTHRRNVPA